MAEGGTDNQPVSNTGHDEVDITAMTEGLKHLSISTTPAHTGQTGVGACKNDSAFPNEVTSSDRQETTDPTVDIDAGHHRSTKPPPHGNETIDHGNLSIKSDKNSEF